MSVAVSGNQKMKSTLLCATATLLLLLPGGAACAADAPPPVIKSTQAAASSTDSSYQIGVLLGNQLEHNGLAPSVRLNQLIKGLKEGLAGHQQSTAERDSTLHFMRSALQSLVESNKAAARDFLARNAKEPSVRSMPSGLQYRVLAEGIPSGTPPAPTDQVTVRYRATLLDGHEFDRSDTHDRPATFRVNSVFKAWQEAFQTMKPGARWQLFVPPELGYGGNTPVGVPPGSLIIYDLELLKIEPAPPVDPALLHRAPAAPGLPLTKDAPRP
jgi:FKBP-type peptidyl-prolyl cis-trans isomerase